MYKKSLIIVSLMSLLLVGAVTASAQGGQGNGRGGHRQGDTPAGMGNGSGQRGMNGLIATLPAASETPLSPEIIALMLAGWDDEQHAYAVYEAVIGQFGEVRPFTQILQSESQHIAAWEFLLNRYGVPIPEVPAYELPAFDTLQTACALGAEAEVSNYALYDTMLENFAAYPDLYAVAQALQNASELNHLPAFQRCTLR